MLESGRTLGERGGLASRGRLALLLGLRTRTFLRAGGRGALRRIAPVIGFLVLLAMSLCLASGAWAATRWLAAEKPGLLREWTHLSLLFVWVSLTLLPLLGFAGSDFADVAKLYHLPVRPRTVLLAHTLAQFAGGLSLFFLPALLAIASALPGGAALGALRIGLVLVLLLHAAIVGQVLRLLFLHALRSRRFRDLAAVLAAAISAAVYLSFRLLFEAADWRESLARALSAGVSEWLAPLPPLWLAGLLAPGAGLSHAALFAFAFLPLTALLVPLAAVLMDRAFYADVPVAAPRRAAAGERGDREAPPLLGWLPGAVRAVAGQQLRLLRREPALKALLIQQGVFILAPLVLMIAMRSSEESGHLPAIAEWGGYLLLFVQSSLSFNLFGLDGPGVAALLASPIPRRRLLLGKAISHVLLWGVIDAVLFAALLGWIAVRQGPLPFAAAAACAATWAGGLLTMLGVGAVISVLAPYPLSAASRRAVDQAGSSRGGCLRAVVHLLAVCVLAAVLVPGFLLGRVPGAVVFTPVFGLVVLLVGVTVAGALMPAREERLLSTFVRG